MYNRYIPSANGDYVRHQVDDAPASFRAAPPAARAAEPPPACEPIPTTAERCDEPKPKLGFLQRLLPKNLELGDILILLILLLLMLDSEDADDSLTVLLTVAAFLIVQ